MRIEIRKDYPWGSNTATYTDPERGWESDDPTFLLLVRTMRRVIDRQLLESDYSPNPFEDMVEALAKRMGAEITRMEFDANEVERRAGAIY